MGTFQGTLNSNEIFAALYNMIISQQVFADNIKGTYSSLVDKARVDGSLYGDKKLYYATDALKTHVWGADTEATNLLALHRPPAPECQEITLDQFRQIDLTVDNYLSKRAWMDEGSFSSFNSVMLGWMRQTKRIYDSTLYNAFIGTTKSSANRADVDVTISTAISGLTGNEAARVEGQTIARAIADLFVDMRDVTRDFNDYKFLRSYDLEDLIIVWNSSWVNKIEKIDLPTIFHKENLVDKFAQEVLPARFFGEVIDNSNASSYVYDETDNPTGPLTKSGSTYTVASGTGKLTVRTLIEEDVEISGTTYHLFPGDKVPNGATFTIDSTHVPYIYVEDPDVICKVMHKSSAPIMSAFEVGTSFFNPKSLTENHYLTWGYNTLEIIKNYPFITVNAE